MSTIYVVEPPTKGKVVLNTTYGPIDIELWPKEAPKATRNFLQLCLEGYYDNNIVHRIIRGFMIQSGDPTGTGKGGESIYGKAFSDEFHSRLRFKHRGLVACANAGPAHTNGSQFFITLDRCEWLDKKNTIFGKVTGDSIFNLLRFNDVETDKEDRPVDPAPKILSVEVLWDPFDDIVPRKAVGKPSETVAENKDQKKKPVKKLSLLSFGEEAEQEEKELATVKQKIKSSHDVLNDPRLLRDDIPKEDLDPAEVKRTKDLQLSVREALSSKKESQKRSETKISESEIPSDDDDDQFDARMRSQILRKRQELGDQPSKRKSHKRQEDTSHQKDRTVPPPRSEDEDEDDDKRKVEKLSFRKKGIGSEKRAERMAKGDADMELLNQAEKMRQIQKQKKRRRQGHEEEVLARLNKFKTTLSSKSNKEPEGEKPKPNSEYKEDLSGWNTVTLAFNPEDAAKDDMARKEKVDDYVVHDPLLEKGKEKFNIMMAKQKRRGREWAGKSLD
ncbi:peptidylprolyl isomerase [Ranunculus cassubicifolius]